MENRKTPTAGVGGRRVQPGGERVLLQGCQNRRQAAQDRAEGCHQGSDFSGYSLSVDICNVEASGGSDIYITVNKELSARASGGSDVYYKGSGLIRDIKTSGSSI